MKILTNFDKAVADVLAEKVKARLTFKVYPDRCVQAVCSAH
jgi:transcription initiation factor TFIIA small subunit